MMFAPRSLVACCAVCVGIVGLSSRILAAEPESAQPPIPVRFSIDRPGMVTLVIEDADGKRVRNLIAETRFTAGDHTVYWDGLDESFTKPKAGDAYVMAGKLVAPGKYRVRGLVYDGVDLRYQFTTYNAGSPPWPTPDKSGAWLADHTPPGAILFLPQQRQMMIGSFVAEAGDGLIWTDLAGKKIGGVRWVGGTWAAACLLARDDGDAKSKSAIAYIASAWMEPGKKKIDNPKGEIRLSSIDASGTTKSILLHVGYANRDAAIPIGMAVRNGIMLVTVQNGEQMLVVDTETAKGPRGDAKVLASVPSKGIGSLAFDGSGQLLAITGNAVHRYAVGDLRALKTLPAPQVLISSGLDEPQQLATDARGNIYVSNAGKSHQVKVFDARGKLIRDIGKAGAPGVGRYDPEKMQNPKQMAVTDDGRIWVAEDDFLPKRVSVWSLEGKLLTDFIGPPDYGAGGEIDPQDPTRFYYADSHAGTMELELDWKTGTNKVKRVLYRPSSTDLLLETRDDGNGFISPQTPLYLNDRQYLVNQYNSTPTAFPSTIGVWLYQDEQSPLVAAAGNAYYQPWLRTPEMQKRWPAEIDYSKIDDPKYAGANGVLFVWSDLNSDRKPQPDEVQCVRSSGSVRAISVNADLAFVLSSGERLKPSGFNAAGVPTYDMSMIDRVVPEPLAGGNLLDAGGGWAIFTGGPLKGYRDGKLAWSYPNQWPSLHAGHLAPKQQYPGQLIATTKIVGYDVKPAGAQTAPIWAYNGDRGTTYLLTNDGLFVAQLFRDERTPEFRWDRIPFKRGMEVTNNSVPGENFWPRVMQLKDGNIYIVTGKYHSSIVKINGLETLRPIDPTEMEVTAELLAKVGPYLAEQEAVRQANRGPTELTIPTFANAPTIDGKQDEWKDAQWVKVDDNVEAAAAVAGDRLYLAYRSTGGDFLDNQPQSVPTLFKSGGALDLMLGGPAGNRRLLITRDKDKSKVVAAYYEPKVAGVAAADRVAFSSPWRTIYFDRVTELSEQVNLKSASFSLQVTEKKTVKTVNYTGYEASVPLAAIGLTPLKAGTIRGDIGILRGSGGQTSQRLYWHNKGSGLVNDVPGEALLQPELWGNLKFVIE